MMLSLTCVDKDTCCYTGDITEELVDSFFEAEVEMERKICRDVVCTSNKDEEGKHSSALALALHVTLCYRARPTTVLL